MDHQQTSELESNYAYQFTPKTVDRPVGILTPDLREVLIQGDQFNAASELEENGFEVEAFVERIHNAFLDFHLLAVNTDPDTRERIFYDGVSPDMFQEGVPSATEASIEDLLAFFYLGVNGEETFETILRGGIERGHDLDGETGTASITVEMKDVETAADIAGRLDNKGVEAVSIRELQVLYFAGVVTEEEYRELHHEKFPFLSEIEGDRSSLTM